LERVARAGVPQEEQANGRPQGAGGAAKTHNSLSLLSLDPAGRLRDGYLGEVRSVARGCVELARGARRPREASDGVPEGTCGESSTTRAHSRVRPSLRLAHTVGGWDRAVCRMRDGRRRTAFSERFRSARTMSPSWRVWWSVAVVEFHWRRRRFANPPSGPARSDVWA